MDIRFIKISERFEKEITLHILRLLKYNFEDAPLILGIDGPAGEGKTFQTRVVLKKLGVNIYSLSSGQFESENAGEPADIIRQTYKDAVNYVQQHDNNMAAILIDDADVAFGNWGDLYQYTVNTQNVIGELMSLADNYQDTLNNVRIPVILTGNDFSKLYSPLKRAGRMNTFYWNPSLEEKTGTLFELFNWLDWDSCYNLIIEVDKFCLEHKIPSAPTSFYSALRVHVNDDKIWSDFIYYRNNNLMSNLRDSFPPLLDNKDKSYEDILQLAKDKLLQIKLAEKNHINDIGGLNGNNENTNENANLCSYCID